MIVGPPLSPPGSVRLAPDYCVSSHSRVNANGSIVGCMSVLIPAFEFPKGRRNSEPGRSNRVEEKEMNPMSPT
jgi:hypothetical protein